MSEPHPDSALGYALLVIEAYAAEIRNRPALMAQGFCQGVLFREAEATIRRKHDHETGRARIVFTADGAIKPSDVAEIRAYLERVLKHGDLRSGMTFNRCGRVFTVHVSEDYL